MYLNIAPGGQHSSDMGDKYFDLWLSDYAHIDSHIHTVNGEVVHFSIQLIYHDGKQYHQIARYDSKHGTAHKHESYLKSQKVLWFTGQSNNNVLSLGMEDLKINYDTYIDLYRQNHLDRSRS